MYVKGEGVPEDYVLAYAWLNLAAAQGQKEAVEAKDNLRPLMTAAQIAHQPSLWQSKIELGEDFFNEIINHPVPLDMNTLTALKRCALGLDLYLWLVYRTFALRAPLRLSWRQVYRQFGVDPAKSSDKRTVDAFRTKCLRELKKIKLAWPKLNYATAPGLLILHPSTPAIAPLNQAQLTS